MKPPPDLNNEADMIKRGLVSALYSARKDALVILRDAFTSMQQGDDWAPLAINARVARDAADRLVTLAAMWDEVA